MYVGPVHVEIFRYEQILHVGFTGVHAVNSSQGSCTKKKKRSIDQVSE